MAVQELIDAAIGPGGSAISEVTLPAGTVLVRDTINVTNVYGLVIRGAAGPVGTELRWGGEDDRPMWTLNRTQWVRLENFSIRATEDKKLLEGVRRRPQAALLAGLAVPILGGISSLLLPIDDILPLEIRRVHIAEIFGSNFLFGVITACMLVRRTAAGVPVVAPARS